MRLYKNMALRVQTSDKEMMGTWDEMKPISKEKFYMVSFDPQ